MTQTAAGVSRQPIVFVLAGLLFIRGVMILFTNDASEWNALLGTGGLAAMEAQLGALGPILRILQLIEGRLWIIAAFPLFFRLSWGRDVAILVAILGIVVQGLRLVAGNGLSAIVWLIIYIVVAAFFYAAPGIKAYFAEAKEAELKAQ